MKALKPKEAGFLPWWLSPPVLFRGLYVQTKFQLWIHPPYISPPPALTLSVRKRRTKMKLQMADQRTCKLRTIRLPTWRHDLAMMGHKIWKKNWLTWNMIQTFSYLLGHSLASGTMVLTHMHKRFRGKYVSCQLNWIITVQSSFDSFLN